jgi:hypothetical protein
VDFSESWGVNLGESHSEGILWAASVFMVLG